MQIPLQGLLLCAICEGDASPCSKSTIFYEPIDSMLINLQVWQVDCIILYVAIPEAPNFDEGEFSASLLR